MVSRAHRRRRSAATTRRAPEPSAGTRGHERHLYVASVLQVRSRGARGSRPSSHRGSGRGGIDRSPRGRTVQRLLDRAAQKITRRRESRCGDLDKIAHGRRIATQAHCGWRCRAGSRRDLAHGHGLVDLARRWRRSSRSTRAKAQRAESTRCSSARSAFASAPAWRRIALRRR